MRFPYAHLHEAGHGTKNRYRIAAAADPVKQRTEAVRDFAPEEERDLRPPVQGCRFPLAEPRLADVAIIGTQDDYHYAPCRKAMELGYHVLLESPSPRR
ncbi:MAG: Gfo/Idh/MocA family oxidoreductase [Akkermansia sp.]